MFNTALSRYTDSDRVSVSGGQPVFTDGPTAYDLNFRVGSVPVRVHPLFWLITLMMANTAFQMGVSFLLAWVACVFVSILLHELGHVWMGMAFGSRGHILLWGMGGLAIGSNDLHSRAQRIAVSLAGPGIQLILWGAIELATMNWRPTSLLQAYVVDAMIYINLYWALVNLAPVWPLDGGQVARDLFLGANRQHGLRSSLILSLVTAIALAVFLGWMARAWYPFVLFAMFAGQSYMLLQQLPSPGQQRRARWSGDAPEDEADRAPWEQDPDYWKK